MAPLHFRNIPSALWQIGWFILLFSKIATAEVPDGSQIAYADALQNGWVNYSWAKVNFTNSTAVHAGSNAISVTAGRNQALYLHHSPIVASDYKSLVFWIHGGTTGGQILQIRATVQGEGQTTVALATPAADTWSEVTVSLEALGLGGSMEFDGFYIQNATNADIPDFYVDDIMLVASPPPDPIVLHVDASKVMGKVDARIFGLNTAIWDNHLRSPITGKLLTGAGIKILRYPGGSASDNYDWETNRNTPPVETKFNWSGHFGIFAELADTLDVQACITVNYGSGTPEQAAAWVAYANGLPTNNSSLGTDVFGKNWQTVGHWATLRGMAPLATDDGYNFLRANHPAPYGFREWEVGNECYGSWERDDRGKPESKLLGLPHDPQTYAQAFAIFSQKMKAVDPTIHLGVVVTDSQNDFGNKQNGVPNPNENNQVHTGWTPIVLRNLALAGVQPDFAVYHFYPLQPGGESDANLLQAANSLAKRAARIRKMINDYVGVNANIGLAITELNSVSFNPGKQSTNLVNGLFLADAIGCLTKTEFSQCYWWDLRNGGIAGNNLSDTLYGKRLFGDYGLVASGNRRDTPADTPYPTYHAYKLLTHWATGGESVLPAESNYKLLALHAVRHADGTLALLVINKGSSTELKARMEFSGFIPSHNTVRWQYGKPEDLADADLTTVKTDESGSPFGFNFPAYSMTVIHLTPEPPVR